MTATEQRLKEYLLEWLWEKDYHELRVYGDDCRIIALQENITSYEDINDMLRELLFPNYSSSVIDVPEELGIVTKKTFDKYVNAAVDLLGKTVRSKKYPNDTTQYYVGTSISIDKSKPSIRVELHRDNGYSWESIVDILRIYEVVNK